MNKEKEDCNIAEYSNIPVKETCPSKMSREYDSKGGQWTSVSLVRGSQKPFIQEFFCMLDTILDEETKSLLIQTPMLVPVPELLPVCDDIGPKIECKHLVTLTFLHFLYMIMFL